MNNMQPGRDQRPEQKKRYSFRRATELTRWLMSHGQKLRAQMLIIVLISILISLGNLAVPLMMGRAIDSLLQPDHLLRSIALLAVLYLLVALWGNRQGVLVSRLAQKIGFELRKTLCKTILRLPISYTDAHPQGDIMSRMTNDVEVVVQTLSSVIPGLLSSLITIAGCFILLFAQSRTIALVNLGIGVLMMLCGQFYSLLLFSQVHRQQKALGDLNAVVTEAMTQRAGIYAYRKQAQSNQRMTEASDEMMRAGIRMQTLGAVMEPMMSVLGNGSFLVTAILGSLLVIRGDLTVGLIQACLLYSRQMLKPLTEIGMMFSQIQGGLACVDRIHDLVRVPPEPDTGTAVLTNSQIQGDIVFEDVSFSYVRGRPVLEHLNLHISPRQTVAIVGATGIGKTTMMNLLLRFYEPDQGRILLDGVDISDIPRRRLYGAVGAILQDGSIVSDTIANNISYGSASAEPDEIQEAAALVQADTFIQQLPEAYDTVVTPDGSVLSWGQRQLVCLARIPLMHPQVLVFDEATSSVDARTEQQVQRALNIIKEGKTCIIIAHRLNTIRHADRILVLDQGRIVEDGTHQELMALKGRYHSLYEAGQTA